MITQQTTVVQRVLGVLVIGVGKNGLPLFQYIGEEGSSPMNIGHDAVGMAIPDTSVKPTVQPVIAIAKDEPAATTPVAPRRKRRTKEQIAADNAAAEQAKQQPVAAPPVAAPPVAAPPVTTTEQVTTTATTGKKGGRKKAATTTEQKPATSKRQTFKVWMPAEQCIAVAIFTTKEGKTFPVAIWDSVISDKTGKRKFKLAFITTKDHEYKGRMVKYAYHKEGKWEVDEGSTQLSNIIRL